MFGLLCIAFADCLYDVVLRLFSVVFDCWCFCVPLVFVFCCNSVVSFIFYLFGGLYLQLVGLCVCFIYCYFGLSWIVCFCLFVVLGAVGLFAVVWMVDFGVGFVWCFVCLVSRYCLFVTADFGLVLVLLLLFV